jgi:hypothetical protein
MRDPTAPETWREHEHVSTPVENQAQKLLDQAGSPELAKHVIDAVAAARPASQERGAIAQTQPASHHDHFARQLGFASYLSLFEGSTPVKSSAGRQWFVTALRTDHWIVWNDADLTISGAYETREAAERSLPPADSERSV